MSEKRRPFSVEKTLMIELKCPRDGEVLVAREVSDHAVAACPRCQGIYLERGELNEVAEPIPGDVELSTVDLDTFEHEDRAAIAACPRCAPLQMKKVEFVGDGGIILDYCTKCGGFWLDDHELDTINAEIKRLLDTSQEVHDPPWLFLVRLAASITG